MVGRFETFARQHPWQAASLVAALSAVVVVVVRAVMGDGSHVLPTLVVTFVGVWMLMGGLYKLQRLE